ncbi:MAG: hypothetical protein ACRDTF_08950, partial [Pseudonocardiaceae bacterium]
LERVLDVLVRLATDRTTEDVLAPVVAQRHTTLVQRCAEQTRGAALRPGRTGLLDALTRLHLKLLTDQRVADFPRRSEPAHSAVHDERLSDSDFARPSQLVVIPLAGHCEPVKVVEVNDTRMSAEPFEIAYSIV